MKEKELPKPDAQERLGKAYEAAAHEDAIYKMWEESGKFNPDNYDLDENSGYFSIVMPPPNVTGVLHLGHSMTVAIEDLMVRYNRMLGKRTLFLPGTDHAAIATQARVEQLMLKEEGIKRHDLSRQEFFDRIQKFAKESRKNILHQVRKLGASCDWSREKYTLDEDVSLAVKEVFIRMYRDGLIYRGDRVINWCPHCQSTLSDDEVNYKAGNAKFYTFKYDKNFPIEISTTRPETKLADAAVAVHPSDERYKEYVGKTYKVNFAGVPLKIKIIADHRVDKDFGTGALGVTPAHSMADYQLAMEHDLPVIKLINSEGKINENGGEYQGKTVLEARKGVTKWIKDNDLLIEEKDIAQNLSVCYRCDNPIEPMPMLQWFIGVNKEFKINQSKIEGIKDGETVTLKQLMRQVATESQIEFIPERFKDIYLQWIENLNDWCISRQVIFGHRIPVWYKNEDIYVGMEPPDGKDWKEETDTLDTWFSSGLWPFSTLGWPLNVKQDTVAERYEQKNDFERFFPTTILETGYDILFFWVARMILMSTYTQGDIPFQKVYLHGLVLDEKGQKMSKSKGNAINPLDLIPKYGADAIRLSMVIGMTPGNNMRLYDQKIEGARNLVNKLYNIARYIIQSSTVILSASREGTSVERPKARTLADEWILNELDKTIYGVTKKIEEYDFSLAGEELRKFTWDTLADWYLEIAKVEGNKDDILNYLLEKILILWHPFTPFVTEYLWGEAGYPDMLMTQHWPMVIPEDIKKVEFDLIQEVVSTIRNMRAENKIEPVLKLNCLIVTQYDKQLKKQAEIIKRLCRLDHLEMKETIKERPKQSATGVFADGNVVYLLLEGIIDIEKEKARLEKEIDKTLKEVTALSAKLDQAQFVKNAPQEIVEAEKARFAQAQDTLEKMRSQLASLV